MEILQWVGFVGGIAAAAYLTLAWGKVYWKKRIDAWAKRRGVVVLSYRGAASFEGPGGLLRSENQTTFRVRIREPGGGLRQGWLVFGRNWNPASAPDELVREVWD